MTGRTGRGAFAHPSIVSAVDMAGDRSWLVELTESECEALRTMAVNVAGSLERISPDDAAGALPRLARDDFYAGPIEAKLRALRARLLHGLGFAQIRGFDTAGLSRLQVGAAFWGVAMHLGDRLASQNQHGHLLGHVTNLGESRTNASQRGPYSRETIPFHVDACDVVGLMCLTPALSGGESSIASSGLIYNEMLRRRPELVEALTRPIYRDRRDEVPPGKAPWYAIPIFNEYAGLLTTSIEPTYIGSVARHFDGNNPHTALQLEGIEFVQELAQELHFDIEFEQGDMQFVNNHMIMHSRKAFVDPDDGPRRHLLRLWVLADDGRPLPDPFYGRHGDRQSVRRPGGIVGADTVLNVPLFSANETQV